LHEFEKQRLVEEENIRSVTDTGIPDMALTSNWMLRTNWAETFNGADRQLLLRFTESPIANGQPLQLGIHGTTALSSESGDERELVAIGDATDRFFDRCEDTALHTDNSVRCWLRSQIPGCAYKAPFRLPGRKGTTVRYRRHWKRMLYASIRLYRLGEAVCVKVIGLSLSKERQRAVENLLAVVQAVSSDETSSRLPECSTLPSGPPHPSDGMKTHNDDGSGDVGGMLSDDNDGVSEDSDRSDESSSNGDYEGPEKCDGNEDRVVDIESRSEAEPWNHALPTGGELCVKPKSQNIV
jgi:hypothetical protein